MMSDEKKKKIQTRPNSFYFKKLDVFMPRWKLNQIPSNQAIASIVGNAYLLIIKKGCSWYSAVLCGLAKTIIALHFSFTVTCVVRCGLEFSQNHNCTAPHFCGHMCSEVYKIRFQVKSIIRKDYSFFKSENISSISK